MSFTLSPEPWLQFTDQFGATASNGVMNWFAAGSTTPIDVYRDNIGTPWGPGTGVVPLDANGRATVYLQVGVTYKVAVYDALGSLVRPAQDNILAVLDVATAVVTSTLDFIQIECFVT